MTRLRFVNDHTTSGGRTYKGGTVHEVNDDDARSLVFRGKAAAEPAGKASAPAAAVPSAPAETEAKKGL